MGMPSLPAELWRLIVFDPCLCKSDLAHLSAVSFHLLHFLRPLLYRNVHLQATGRESNSTAALALLATDKSLAKYVIELNISRHNKRRHGSQ
jgi:hypothetical protein